jgi:hypothetical protein
MLSLLVSSRDNRMPPPPLGLEFSFTTIPTPVARGWRCRKPNDGGGVYDSETAIVVVVLLVVSLVRLEIGAPPRSQWCKGITIFQSEMSSNIQVCP